MHNILRAHGAELERIRGISPDAVVGVTLSQMPVFPASGSERDLQATRVADAFLNRIDLDPILRGRYPDLLRQRAHHAWYIPFLKSMVSEIDVAPQEFERDGIQYTATGQEVYQEGLYQVASMLRDEYGNPPVFITENGAAFEDQLESSGVHDPKRTAYLQGHLAMLSKANRKGCDIRGYFVWSLLDNFELSEGTGKRFGIVYVDFPSQRRVIKDSGRWYAELIRRAKDRER